MKKSRICLFIIFILAASCAKSRFATTTRHYHDGKVTYTNHYSNERINLKRNKTKRLSTLTQAASAKTARNPVDNPNTINKLNPIASSDKNFLILNNMEKLISQYTYSLYPEFHNEKELTQSKYPWDTLKKDLATVSSKENSLGDSTTVKKRDNSKENAAGIKKTDNRKTEKLGLAGFILSFPGMIPLIGIPFAVLAIIFGTISLKKIKRNPEKYKGKGFAIASIVIGCVMIAMNIVLLISSINTASTEASHSYSSSRSENCD
jgi:hypothetical protein